MVRDRAGIQVEAEVYSLSHQSVLIVLPDTCLLMFSLRAAQLNQLL